MGIAVSEEHRSLAEVVGDFAAKREVRAAARGGLEAPEDRIPDFWGDMAALGWLGLHLPEKYGGSGYGFEELVVVVEELSRNLAPGPIAPTLIVSALISASADVPTKDRLLPKLASGELVAAAALDANITVSDGRVTGTAEAVLGAAVAHLFLLPVGDDVALVERGDGVSIDSPETLDPTRRVSRVQVDGAPAALIPGLAGHWWMSRTILAADAVGIAAACTSEAAEYAKVRVQFGRVIGTFQAIKHHCANMYVASEVATAAVWDAARAASNGGEQFSYAAGAAATLSASAAYQCANLNIQVHGGIGYTWEHDAHLYLRRAVTLFALLDPDHAAEDITDLTRRGVIRTKTILLPPEAEKTRADVRAFLATLDGLDPAEKRSRLGESGYLFAQTGPPRGVAEPAQWSSWSSSRSSRVQT